MKSVELISEKNLTPNHNKKSRRNTKVIYHWELRSFLRKREIEFQYDIFPSSSELDKMSSELRNILLTKLNTGSAFDFLFTPTDRDVLRIEKKGNRDVFMAFIFLNGQWVEEQFVGSLFNLVEDEYKTIETGEIRLNVDSISDMV